MLDGPRIRPGLTPRKSVDVTEAYPSDRVTSTRKRVRPLSVAAVIASAAALILGILQPLDAHAESNSAHAGYTTLFGEQAQPDSTTAHRDYNSVELGVKFKVNTSGTIDGLRFYRAAGDSAAHAATLWNDGGGTLAQLSFPASTTVGWQYSNFDSPVAVDQGSYVASYHTSSGYAAKASVFAGEVDRRALTIPGTTANGLFVYSSSPQFPTQNWNATNYYIDVLMKPTTFAPTAPTPPTDSPTAPTPPTDSSTTPALQNPLPSGTIAPSTTPVPTTGAGKYVTPGSVGYLGSVAALTRYDRNGAVPGGQGCSWEAYGLACKGDANGNLTLDHAYVVGGLYFSGSGSATVTSSIIEGGGGSEWYTFYAATTSAQSSAKLTFHDSTLRWSPKFAYPAGYDVAPIWTRGPQPMDVQRSDISGMPQGIDPTGGSTIKDNWIHGLVQNSKDPSKPTHLDGIFSQGGSDILIQGNYVDAPIRNPSDITAALFLQNLSGTDTGVTVDSNYLKGGSYTLRNETVVGLVVTNNTFDGATYGHGWNQSPGSIATWNGNIQIDGTTVSKP